MKFSDGNWMMLPGVRAHYAAEVYEAEVRDGGLDLLVPTRKIRHRGDTLEGPVLTIRLSSPMPDVIRVQATHYIGESKKGPAFELEAQSGFSPEVFVEDEEVRLTSGAASVVWRRLEGDISFESDTQAFAGSPARGLGLMQVEGQGSFMMGQVSLGV
ncbi:MAG: alpha-xylosidase, partial [Chlorobia bacterium]|nr:alpha-xylosidase [Fimbriimonadaceae bacterium]